MFILGIFLLFILIFYLSLGIIFNANDHRVVVDGNKGTCMYQIKEIFFIC